MNFFELKEIVKQLKKTVNCNICKKKFHEEDINLLSSIGDDMLFQFDCCSCKNRLVAHVSVVEQNEKENILDIHTHDNVNYGPINKTDVTDMRNFLDKFRGDFNELFKS